MINKDIKAMTKRVVLAMCALVLAYSGFSSGYQISIRLGSALSKQVYLAYYYGPNIFVADTVTTDQTGYAVFRRDTLLPQGLYKIYLDQDHHFDFLLGADQHLSISNPAFSFDGIEITGATESVEFLKYVKWLRPQQEKRRQLEIKRDSVPDTEKALIDKQLAQMSDEVTNYWKETAKKYPGSFLSTFLMANYYRELKDDEIPAEYAVNDSLKWSYHYNYRKNHFFDYFDLTDERLLFTPLIKPKLETYFERILLQVYDSVKPAAYQMIKKVEPYPRMYRYILSHLLNSSLNSRIMGMDALFVDLARDYYLSGKAAWADSASLAKIRENVIFLDNTLIGKKARDFQMETYNGEPFRLYQQSARNTILVFYEPNCSHCREYVPQLYKEIYLPLRDKGVEVIAVYTMNNKKEWGEFIAEHHLTDWANIWDEHHLSRFKIVYDTRTTPTTYLLDNEKTIIAKKFTIEFLKQYFQLQ